MAVYKVQAPDGSIMKIEGPDNASDEQIAQAAAAGYQPKEPETGPLARVKALAKRDLGEVRDIVAGGVRGAGSIGATLLAPVDIANDALAGKGLSLESNRQRRRDMDAGLADLTGADTSSLGYNAGKMGVEVLGTMGAGGAAANVVSRAAPQLAAKAPAVINALRSSGMTTGGTPLNKLQMVGDMGARMTGGAISGGLSAGLVNPEDAGFGALVGGALPPAMAVAGKAGAALGNSMRGNTENADLARKAIDQYGIPLGIADITQNRTLKAARSVMNDAPLTGGIGASQREVTQAGYNRAVGETFGAGADKLTPQVMDAAKRRMGGEFDRIWNNNVVQVDQPMVDTMNDLLARAKKLPRNEAGALEAEVNDLFSKMVRDPNGALTIPGETANSFQSYLRRRAESSPGLKNELGELRQTILGTFNKSVSPADAQALTMTRAQYKAFKTVEPIMNKSEAGVAGRVAGDVPAALLPGEVAKSYSQAGGVPLADLGQIGSRFLADRVAQTGGSARAAIQNSAIGSALTLGAMSNPLALAAVPAAMGVNKLLGSPAMARRMLATPAQPNALLNLIQSGAYRAGPQLITVD